MKHFTAVILRSANGYIARCMQLGIACLGNTPEEAQAGLQEAIEVYVRSARSGERSWNWYPDADSREWN